MKNPALIAAMHISLESDMASADAALDDLVAVQAETPLLPDSQVTEHIESVEADVELLDQAQAVVESTEVSLEQLAHIRGVVDTIGMQYGAHNDGISMESMSANRGGKEVLLANIKLYRDGLENNIVTSMEGILMRGNNLKEIGKNIDTMKKTIAILKTGDVEQIKAIKFSQIKHFLKVGGGFPGDMPRAVREVSRGLELTMKHSDAVLSAAIKAAEIAHKADWKNPDAASKARKDIAAVKLNLDGIVKDVNGYPMFGNRTFGVKVKGTNGDLGEFNRSFSFGDGVPNSGFLHSALTLGGSLVLLAGAIANAPVAVVGGILVILTAITAGSTDTERQIPMKEFAAALEAYAKTAEQLYKQRDNSIKKSVIHGKLLEDLKGVQGLPKDVRRGIANASSFGWSMSNGVYNVVEHSVYALASAGVRAAFH